MNGKKYFTILIIGILILVAIFFITKNKNKKTEEDKLSAQKIENKISNFAVDNEKLNEVLKDINEGLKKETPKIENSVLDYEHVEIIKGANNKATGISFMVYNYSNEKVENRTVECTLYDENKNIIGKTTVFIPEIEANDVFNCEIAVSEELEKTDNVSFREVETKGDN